MAKIKSVRPKITEMSKYVRQCRKETGNWAKPNNWPRIDNNGKGR